MNMNICGIDYQKKSLSMITYIRENELEGSFYYMSA
jgi:hypothetical protein